jgi:hypothetical protein
MEVDDAADAAAQLVREHQEVEDAYAADAARDVEDLQIAQDEFLQSAAAAAAMPAEMVDDLDTQVAEPNWGYYEEPPVGWEVGVPQRDPRETALVSVPCVKPLSRVPPTEGLNGIYWARMPANFTMVTVPEACDTLHERHLARREGRFLGDCMFCGKDYREVDFRRGSLVYGSCTLWCSDSAECYETMERKRNWLALEPSPPARPEVNAFAIHDAQVKKRHDAIDAGLEGFYRNKKVRFTPRRGASWEVVPQPDPPLHFHGWVPCSPTCSCNLVL